MERKNIEKEKKGKFFFLNPIIAHNVTITKL